MYLLVEVSNASCPVLLEDLLNAGSYKVLHSELAHCKAKL